MNNKDSRLDSEVLLASLRQQIRKQSHVLSGEVHQIMVDSEELTDQQQIAQELVQKFINDPPVRGVIGFELF